MVRTFVGSVCLAMLTVVVSTRGVAKQGMVTYSPCDTPGSAMVFPPGMPSEWRR